MGNPPILRQWFASKPPGETSKQLYITPLGADH